MWSVVASFVLCCLFHEASFSSGLGQANALEGITQSTHTEELSVHGLLEAAHYNALLQNTLKVGIPSNPKLISQASAPPKGPSNTLHNQFLHLHVYRATYWSLKQYIMGLQELLKNPFCHIDCCNEDECWITRYENGSCAFATHIFHPGFFSPPLFVTLRGPALSFWAPKITMCFHSQPLELCLWLCKWENMQEI